MDEIDNFRNKFKENEKTINDKNEKMKNLENDINQCKGKLFSVINIIIFFSIKD